MAVVACGRRRRCGRGSPSLPVLLALGYVVDRQRASAGAARRPQVLTIPTPSLVRTCRGAGGAAGRWPLLHLVARPSCGWLSSRAPRRPVAAAVIVAHGRVWNLGQYARWAAHHDELNYRASVAVGRLLPPGTLVQGKLANGLALENRIQPIFIGHGFGNYDDRFDRDDVRYILTYDLPSIGYESQRRIDAKRFSIAIPTARPSRPSTSTRHRAPIAPCSSTNIPVLYPRLIRTPSCARLAKTKSRRTPTGVSIRVRLRAVRVLPQRQGHRVSRTRRRRRRRPRARRRLRRRRHAAVARRARARKSSASIRSTGSATAGVVLGARARPDAAAFPARRRHGAALCRPGRSTSCCRTRSSSTSPTRRCTCANAGAC